MRYSVLQAVLRSRNYLFRLPLRFRLSKSFGSVSDFSFVTTCSHSFYVIKVNFHVFLRKEYRLNSLACSYSIRVIIFIYYFSLTGAGAETSCTGSGQKFRLLAPGPKRLTMTPVSEVSHAGQNVELLVDFRVHGAGHDLHVREGVGDRVHA